MVPPVLAALRRSAARHAALRAIYREALHALNVARNLGARGAPAYLLAERAQRLLRGGGLPAPRTYELRARSARYPLHCRAGSSDRQVFRQIFVDREYAPLDAARPRLIVDCGANVGYSTAYFLSRFPDAHVIAVEPDAGNFAMLERNTRPFAARTTLVRSGVWSHETPLVVCRDGFRDAQEWAVHVRECGEGEAADLMAVDVGTLLDRSGFDRIDVLKIDVEGAERAIFARNYERWIHRVDAIVVELHGSECSDVFFRALPAGEFDVSLSYDVTICRRRPAPVERAHRRTASRLDDAERGPRASARSRGSEGEA